MISRDSHRNTLFENESEKDPLFVLGTTFTASGVEFDASSQHWKYRDETYDISLNFSSIAGCTTDFIHQLKYLLKWYASNLSTYSLKNAFERLKSLISFTYGSTRENLEVINSSHLLAFSSSLPKNDGITGSVTSERR